MPEADPETEPLALGRLLEPDEPDELPLLPEEPLEPLEPPEPLLPDELAPVVPDVLLPADVPEFGVAPLLGALYSGFDIAESRVSILPDALPPAEPMPEAEPDTEPLALGAVLELPEEVDPLGVDDAHAARVKAHATGMIHLFIEISLVLQWKQGDGRTRFTSRHALSM